MIVEYDLLKRLKRCHAGEKIVFISGSFDITHPGHLFLFKEAKKLGRVLVVTVGRDAEISKNKGPGRPILNEDARMYMVDGLKPVDYTFLTNRPAEGRGWLDPIREIFELLRPDVYVMNSDAHDIPERQRIAHECGIEPITLGMYYETRGERVSTSWLIEKIKRQE